MPAHARHQSRPTPAPSHTGDIPVLSPSPSTACLCRRDGKVIASNYAARSLLPSPAMPAYSARCSLSGAPPPLVRNAHSPACPLLQPFDNPGYRNFGSRLRRSFCQERRPVEQHTHGVCPATMPPALARHLHPLHYLFAACPRCVLCTPGAAACTSLMHVYAHMLPYLTL